MKEALEEQRQKFEHYFFQELERLKDQYYPSNQPLHKACRYALSGSGKFARPFLTFLSFRACGGESRNSSLPAELAIELIHTYSLVHDDLPSMDNDDLRRGRPTVHVEFDVPTALLTGDSLLTDAFSVISSWPSPLTLDIRARMIGMLSHAAGGKGMVLGQALDILETGKRETSKETLDSIHLNKTGKLIGCALGLGALAAHQVAKAEQMQSIGEKVGLAFQIIDDILDNYDDTGKSKGKDLEQGKQTYLTHMTSSMAQKYAERLSKEAASELTRLGIKDSSLSHYFQKLLSRTH